MAGVDVGGTFTDLIVCDPATGAVELAKVPTTLPDQSGGVLAAFDAAGVDLAALALIVHGTTTTTNAVLERKFAKTGLITTEGFRDVLELGRRTRPQPYGMAARFTPVIPRDLRLEVPERMDAKGRVLLPLDEAAVARAVRHLRDAGCEAVVIHFLHAYANPAHEARAAAIAAAEWPGAFVTCGHHLLSESREYERGVTAAVNASVQPILQRYIGALADRIAARGHPRELLVMNGNGGMVGARSVAREAVRTVMSGPASGVMAALATGRRAGVGNLLTCDMGGTSTDVAMIVGGVAPVSNEIEVDYALPIHVPMVDVRTIGAGGGSIARVDAGGMLRVGPESAGSVPGPVCYGRGGTRATISDANLILGRLPPDRFGTAAEAARAALEAQVARPLGLDVEAAAEAVLRLATVHMAGAVRMVSLSLGADPRDFALFAFGGAGPLHAVDIARELGVPRVLVPARPGLTNALGCVVADLRHDAVRTLNRPLDAADMDEVHAILAAQEAEGRRQIGAGALELEAVTAAHWADMQFQGQTHLLRVALPDARPDRATLARAFAEAYRARFRVELPEIRATLVNLCTAVIGRRPALDLTRLIDPAGRRATLGPAQHRPVRFDGRTMATPVYWREHLPLSAVLDGPAVIEQMDSTTVLPPGARATQDGDGNLWIEVHHAG
jgi:N-methylhydantoinase A